MDAREVVVEEMSAVQDSCSSIRTRELPQETCVVEEHEQDAASSNRHDALSQLADDAVRRGVLFCAGSASCDSVISSAQRLLAQGTGNASTGDPATLNTSLAYQPLTVARDLSDGEVTDARRADGAFVGGSKGSLAGSIRDHPRPPSSEPPGSSISTRHVRRKLWSPVDGSGGGLGTSSRASLTPGLTPGLTSP